MASKAGARHPGAARAIPTRLWKRWRSWRKNILRRRSSVMDLEETGVVDQQASSRSLWPSDYQSGHRNSDLRRFGKSLSRAALPLFGGPHRREINLVGGLGMDLEAGSDRRARSHAPSKRAFAHFKIKIGQPDHAKDIERVRAVRQAVGDDASIRVDGNAAYSFADARVVLHELSRFHITDAEQPLTRSDLRSLAELRRAVGIPIAAQESVSSPEDALAVLEEQAADLLKIKLTHIGGFESAREVAAVVGAKGLPVVIGQGERVHDDPFRRGDATSLCVKKCSTRR